MELFDTPYTAAPEPPLPSRQLLDEAGVHSYDVGGIRHLCIPTTYIKSVLQGEHHTARSAAGLVEHILKTYGLKPDRRYTKTQIEHFGQFQQSLDIIFEDDVENVGRDAARRLGIECIKGVSETISALRSLKLAYQTVQEVEA